MTVRRVFLRFATASSFTMLAVSAWFIVRAARIWFKRKSLTDVEVSEVEAICELSHMDCTLDPAVPFAVAVASALLGAVVFSLGRVLSGEGEDSVTNEE